MKNIKLLYIVGLTALILSSCNDFLNVNPKSSLSEDQMFSSEMGFKQTLSGVYSQIAERSLYGDNLSMGFVSALAQNYNPAAHGFVFKETTALNYESSEVKERLDSIWSASYNAIAGLNNILDKIEKQKGLFTGTNYNLIKGEALGLRAYLHFDLLRLFAANPNLEMQALAIPYKKVLGPMSQKPELVGDFLNLVLADLMEAEGLLKGIDSFVQKDKSRRFKMNSIAVIALQARVNLYKGDKVNAKAAALAVVETDALSFVTNAEIATSSATKDRLFSNEQVFAVRVADIKDWTESGTSAYFRYTTSLSKTNLTRSDANFATLYETGGGGGTDYRFVYLLENDGTTKFPSKFWQTSSALDIVRLDHTVPLIRLSEMYYILAESSSNVAEGVGYLNKVRKHRGLAEFPNGSLDAVSLSNEIVKEYQKEFYAEGQLFFMYKRLNFPRMQFNSRLLNSSIYIMPIPDTETEFNPQYN